MSFREEVKRTISPYIREEAAQGVVASLLCAVRTVDAVLKGQVDDEVKSSAVQILFDFTAGLNSNPFWLRNAGYLMPVFTNAVAGWLHSYRYAKPDATAEEKITFLVARNVLAETAVAVLYCERGAKALAEEGAQLREAIMKLRM